MRTTERVVARSELYALVWAEPMGRIAERFGISDVGLRKICDRADIPVPRAGYWMKVAHGKRVGRRPTLRPRLQGEDDIVISPSGIRAADIDAELPDDIASVVAEL